METLPKVNVMALEAKEGTSPKYPAKLMVTVACSGEALQEPIKKERFVIPFENVEGGHYS